MKNILFVIHRSSLPLSGHQSRNVRIKKRGTISSAWLEKYKPKLDTDHCVSHSNSLRESNSESENIHCHEEMSTTEENNLDRENTCNTLSTTEKNEISCSTENDEETPLNSLNVARRNTKKKKPEIKLNANNLKSDMDGSCKRDDKTVATYKCKEREDEKYTNEELHLKVSDADESTRKSCTNGSDFVSVSNPIMSNALGEDAESAFIEDSRDSPVEITRNKRKAGRETSELEKPRKKLRCESDNDEEICEEIKE